MNDMNARYNAPKQEEVDLQRTIDELTALNGLIRSVTGSLEESEVIDAALTEIRHILKPDLSMVFLSESGDLILKGSLHAESEAMNTAIPPHKVGECLCGLAVSTGEAVYSTDILNDPRCTWHECKNMQMRSAATLPLKDRGDIFGILVLASLTPRNFEQEKTFLETVTGQIAAGLKNARLYRQLQLQSDIQQSLRCNREYLEGKLAKNEERFRLAMEATDDGLWDWDVNTNEVYYSPGYIAMLSYRASEVPADVRFWMDLIHPEDKESVLNTNIDCIENRCDNFDIEFRMKTKNGEWRWILGRGKVVERDKSGRAIRMVGTHTDITERKKAEAMLQKSRSDLMVILNNLPFLAWLKDSEGRFMAVNVPFAHACGHSSPEELIGKTDLDIWPKHLAEGYRADDKAVMLSGKKKAVEEVISDHGVDNWFETYKAPLFDVDGKCTGTTGFARDISERKREEESLKKREENFRQLIDRNPVAMAVADKDGKFSFFNNKFIETFGYTLEDISSVDEWWPRAYPDEEYRQKVINGWRTAANKAIRGIKQMGHQEWRVTCKDGSFRDIEFSMASLQDFDVVIFHDVTERKVLEQQFIQAQKMESVARLAGGVAHDFNNMLGVILGHVELARMKMNPEDRINANLEEIQAAAQRSANLTRQLLAFARRQPVTPKVVDLNDGVAAMLKMLQRLIGEDINLVFIPGSGLWPVKVDPTQIDQLLANLCVNARDAIGGVGRITIETENIAFDKAYCDIHIDFVCGEYVMLAMSDDGSGMSKEIIDHLFEPFFTTKEIGKGTGLGLATVYGIVKQNEGFIKVYSNPGEGTTFKVYLPRFEGQDIEQQPGSTAEIPKGRGETILLVEDEGAILNVGRAMLEELGYKVLTAGKPSAALRLTEAYGSEIQLLITDVVMPEMNGRDLAKFIRDMNPGLKCLFTSGYTADVIAHHSILDEGVNFLQKPFSMNDLASRVSEALEQK
ncbi:MAG: PAS domain S-box protein [Dissulfurispiraceae bacterium]